MASLAPGLRDSLERHNARFEALLRLIPAKYYLPQDEAQDAPSRYLKNSKKHKAPKQAIKEASKKAKRERLDPANNKTILEIQEELLNKGSSGPFDAKKHKQVAREDDETDAALEVDVTMDVDSDSEDSDEQAEGDASAIQFTPMASGGINDLRAKLRARMEALRTRGQKKTGETDAGSKDELLEERRAKRAVIRERQRKEKKERKKQEQEEKGKKGKEKESIAGSSSKVQLIVPDTSRPNDTSQDPSTKFTNVSFSTVNGATSSISKKFKTSANPQQALAQLSARSEKVASLPDMKRKELEEREKWQKAQARMEGGKVRDDESRLKKAVKRKEKTKEKTKKNWDERKEQLTSAMAAKQKKRGDNIAMRNERRKDKKKGIKPKPTKSRPGFEGKSFGKGVQGGKKSKGKS